MKGIPTPGARIGTPAAALEDTVLFKLGDPGISEVLDLPRPLPELLEARRKEFAIPDCCFTRVAAFGRVLLYQIHDKDHEKVAPGSMLWAPQRLQDKNKAEAPRGVIVTAGLKSLDFLWANGMDLGSVVNFVRMSPWRMPVGHIAGKEITLHVVRVGDIVACEDLVKTPHRVVLDEEHALHQLEIGGKVRPRADLQAQDEDDSY